MRTFAIETVDFDERKLWRKLNVKLSAPHLANAHQPSQLAKLSEKFAQAIDIIDELEVGYRRQLRNDEFQEKLRNFNVRLMRFESFSQAASKARGHFSLPSLFQRSMRENTALAGNIDVPLITYLTVEYVENRTPEIRELLIKCLRLGADPNAVSPWTIAGAPMLLFLTLRIPLDVDLALEIIQAGAAFSAHYNLIVVTPRTYKTGTGSSQIFSGVSILQAVNQDFEQRTLVRRLLSLIDEYFYMSKNGLGNFSTVRASESLEVAFEWLSQVGG